MVCYMALWVYYINLPIGVIGTLQCQMLNHILQYLSCSVLLLPINVHFSLETLTTYLGKICEVYPWL